MRMRKDLMDKVTRGHYLRSACPHCGRFGFATGIKKEGPAGFRHHCPWCLFAFDTLFNSFSGLWGSRLEVVHAPRA